MMHQQAEVTKTDPRPSGGGGGDCARTYQDLLDEALTQTFPASDPIAPGGAAHANRPVSTPKNPTDWQLEPGASAQADIHPDAHRTQPGDAD